MAQFLSGRAKDNPFSSTTGILRRPVGLIRGKYIWYSIFFCTVPERIRELIHCAIAQLRNENVVTLSITPGGDTVALDRTIGPGQMVLTWRPAKQRNDIFVMLVNEGGDRAILDHICPSSNEGVPGSWGTDHRGCKIESRG